MITEIVPDKTITFLLDGIPFTGKLLKTYMTPEHDIKFAVQVQGYAINGKWFTVENDDSAVHVSADCVI